MCVWGGGGLCVGGVCVCVCVCVGWAGVGGWVDVGGWGVGGCTNICKYVSI